MTVHAHALRDTARAPVPLARGLDQAIAVIARDRGEHRSQRLHLCHKRAGLPLAPAAAGHAGAPAVKPACELETNALEPEFDRDTRTLKLSTSSRVKRGLAELRPVLDPRGWGRCSDFFDADRTYRLKVVGGKPVRDKTGEFQRDDGREPMGQSWSGLLRERFDGPGIAVDTILVIDFISGAEDVTVYYALYLSDRCVLGPFTDVGGVRMNTGKLKATPEGDWTKVEVTKSLRFVDFTPGDTGGWVDFGDALSLMMVMMGVIIDDKFVLKLCCGL